MLDYLLLPLMNYLAIGIDFNAQFHIGARVALLAVRVAVVTISAVVGITIVKNINLVLVVTQLAFAVVFVGLVFTHAIRHPERSSSCSPFTTSACSRSPLFAGAAILALLFLGFDTISTLSEERRQSPNCCAARDRDHHRGVWRSLRDDLRARPSGSF